MYYNLLNQGDSVLSINESLVAIERADGSLDLYPISIKDGEIVISTSTSTTIGMSSATFDEYTTDSGVQILEF